jgi:shikimate kinase
MAPLVVLVGPPGAGKTTVGHRLAVLLATGFRDTDEDVADTAGSTIADLFIEHGEEHFRALEREAVATAIAEHEGVLSLGGGAVLDAGSRALLREQQVAFLDVGIADAARRIGFNRDRPLLIGNPRASWLRLMNDRRPLYDEVATVTVETDGLDADQVAESVVHRLGLARTGA